MKHHILSIFIVSFLTAQLRCMNEETNKKQRHKPLKRATKNLTTSPTADSLIGQMMFVRHYHRHKKLLPPEALKNIILYSVALKSKEEFDNKHNIFTYQWHQFKIPPSFFYCLNKKQCHLIKSLITSSPSMTHNELYYTLKSHREYALFLTLPLPLRKRLCYKPLRYLSQDLQLYDESCELKDCLICSEIQINQRKQIRVKAKSMSLSTITDSQEHKRHFYELKYIVPEDNIKK